MGRITHLARLGVVAETVALSALVAPAAASPAPAGHVYVQTDHAHGIRQPGVDRDHRRRR
jgi:hypothetical protein